MSAEPILYNSKTTQGVVLKLEKNGREYRLVHHLSPLTDERYFRFQESEANTIARLKKINSQATEPVYKLWLDLCESVEGYAYKDDWKDRIHREDAMAAISGLLFVQVIDESEMEEDTALPDLYDDSVPTRVQFRAMTGGALVTLTHSFREASQSESDEFLAITTNQPNDRELASAVKKSEAQKLYELGKRILVDADGYAPDSTVPPWHLAQTVKAFFIRESERMGKFLTPSHLTPGG